MPSRSNVSGREVASPLAPKQDAAGPMAGYLFQVERAVFHLADAASAKAVVGIETLDDVVVLEGDQVVIREQDKHTISKGSLTARGAGFWRTLGIWLDESTPASKYFLTTTRTVSSPFLNALLPGTQRQLSKLAQQLRAEGSAAKKNAGVKALVDAVLAHRDDELKAVLARIELHVVKAPDATLRSHLVARLALRSGVDGDAVIDRLFGWVARGLLKSWRHGKPGRIARQAFVNQCRAIESQLERARILPRPSSEVPVTDRDRDSTRGKTFVAHLQAIQADEDDIADATQYFIQFNTEMDRLVRAGDIPDTAWEHRGHRLEERWRLLFRETKRNCRSEEPRNVGVKILSRTTYDYREPVDGQDCDLYMTAGHYHRLADVDRVWWHPLFKRKQSR